MTFSNLKMFLTSVVVVVVVVDVVFCLVCHIYPGDVVVVVVRLSLTLDLGNATCFTHLRKGLSVWWRSRVC